MVYTYASRLHVAAPHANAPPYGNSLPRARSSTSRPGKGLHFFRGLQRTVVASSAPPFFSCVVMIQRPRCCPV
jgi:hypothetical protein